MIALPSNQWSAMFLFLEDAKMIFYSKPTNLNKGFDALTAIVQTELRDFEFNSRTYFLFCNRKRDRIKVLYMHEGNLAIWSRRLNGTLIFKYEDKPRIFDHNSFDDFLRKMCFRNQRVIEKII